MRGMHGEHRAIACSMWHQLATVASATSSGRFLPTTGSTAVGASNLRDASPIGLAHSRWFFGQVRPVNFLDGHCTDVFVLYFAIFSALFAQLVLLDGLAEFGPLEVVLIHCSSVDHADDDGAVSQASGVMRLRHPQNTLGYIGIQQDTLCILVSRSEYTDSSEYARTHPKYAQKSERYSILQDTPE